MEARIKCKSCGVVNELPVEADGDVLICGACRRPLAGPPAAPADHALDAFLGDMAKIKRDWEAGILTLGETESFVSAKARLWLVRQGWITPEMHRAIESRLIRLGDSCASRDPERFASGIRVRTISDAGGDGWQDNTRFRCQWGAEGKVLRHSDSHGLCYLVEHRDGRTAWYDHDELEEIRDG